MKEHCQARCPKQLPSRPTPIDQPLCNLQLVEVGGDVEQRRPVHGRPLSGVRVPGAPPTRSALVAVSPKRRKLDIEVNDVAIPTPR